MKENKDLTLIFHTAFKEEFKGDTPEQVVDALYQNSAKGMGDISFEDWWKYQQTMWSGKYGVRIPEPDTDGAHQALLDVLIKVGALEQGALPQSADVDETNKGAPFVG